MKKRIKIILLPVIAMLLLVGVIIAIKYFTGTSIVHYKQYLFPIQGQVTNLEGQSGRIKFFMLDEEELSEMADSNNLKKIYIETEAGEQIEIENWNLESSNYSYTSDKYFLRTLTLNMTFDKEMVIKTLSIVYPDTTEHFDAGSLKLIPVNYGGTYEVVNLYANIWNLELKNDWTSPDYVPEREDPYSEDAWKPGLGNFINLEGNYRKADIIVKSIDFGIVGLGIDTSTMRVEQGSEFVHVGDLYTFAEQPENAQYVKEDIMVEQMPNQDMDVVITENCFNLFASLATTEEYDTTFCCLYLNPIIRFVDKDTNKEIVGGSDQGCINVEIRLVNGLADEVVEKLLKEKGV